jgi:hypothetical protein
LAASVSEQPVDHSRDVLDVKRCGRDTGRAAVPFVFGQLGNHLADTLAYLEEDVGYRLKNSGNALDGTTLPPLCARHGYSVSKGPADAAA